MDGGFDSSDNGHFLDHWGGDIDLSDHLLFFDHWSVNVMYFFLTDDVLHNGLSDQSLGGSLEDLVSDDLSCLGGVDNILQFLSSVG